MVAQNFDFFFSNMGFLVPTSTILYADIQT